jgi:hypothetical protein
MEDGAKPRDLEDRTFLFAESVRMFVKQLPKTISNTEEFGNWCERPAQSANWIEADEALSKKDFLMRTKICSERSKGKSLGLAFNRCWTQQRQCHKSRCIGNGNARANANFLRDHLKERPVMNISFWDFLRIEFCLGFEN